MGEDQAPREDAGMVSIPPTAKRVFELYIDSLEAERDVADELLIVHLRYFSDDIALTAQRLTENPRVAVGLIHHLSSLMQELDTEVGGIEALSRELGSARRWAILLPENGAESDE